MNPSIKQLAELASKSPKKIIGLMSGTSLDGLDIALCEISGYGTNIDVELRKFTTKPYSTKTKNRLQSITSVPEASMEEVCLLHSWLGNFHGKLILEALDEWNISPAEIDCIASHGQTIYHAPKIQHGQHNMPNSTLQIGDADHIAYTTGILTISDFRQKHTAAGGEGAPMAALIDELLFSDAAEDRMLLNIGGIANFTFLPASNSRKSLITTDTGPGNTLIDAVVRQRFDLEFDRDGKIAQQGTVNSKALSTFKSDPYFNKSLPKTTGPEVFNLDWLENRLQKAEIETHTLSDEDLVATVTRLSSETIAEAITKIHPSSSSLSIYVSGGGLHNPILQQELKELLPKATIKNFSTIGFNPDAKEAVIFAVLANEMLSGEGFDLNQNKTEQQKINFGKISFAH